MPCRRSRALPPASPPHPLPACLPARLSRAPRTDLSPEERESLGKSLFSDYLCSPDLEEAVGTAQELEAPGFMPKLVQVGVVRGCGAGCWPGGGGTVVRLGVGAWHGG